MDLYPPDYTTDLGKLRALIPDVDQVDFTDSGNLEYIFSDQHLGAFLSLHTDTDLAIVRIKRAAANALTAIAVSEALISKVIKTEDLQTDGAKVANALLLAAARLSREADDAEENDGGAFVIVDFQPQPPDFFGEGWRGFGTFCGGGICAGSCGGGCGTTGGNHGSGFGRWY